MIKRVSNCKHETDHQFYIPERYLHAVQFTISLVIWQRLSRLSFHRKIIERAERKLKSLLLNFLIFLDLKKNFRAYSNNKCNYPHHLMNFLVNKATVKSHSCV